MNHISSVSVFGSFRRTDYSPVKGVNILDEFMKSCLKQKIRTDFYYTVMDNNYLHVQHGYVSCFVSITLADTKSLFGRFKMIH